MLRLQLLIVAPESPMIVLLLLIPKLPFKFH